MSTKLIAAGIADALRSALSLTSAACFTAIQAVYPNSGLPLIIEVVIGDQSPNEGGDGFQQGGGNFKSIVVDIVVFKRIVVNIESISSALLTSEANNLFDLADAVYDTLVANYIGGLLSEPLIWQGDSSAAWLDDDSGIVTKTLTYRCGTFRSIKTSVNN